MPQAARYRAVMRSRLCNVSPLSRHRAQMSLPVTARENAGSDDEHACATRDGVAEAGAWHDNPGRTRHFQQLGPLGR